MSHSSTAQEAVVLVESGQTYLSNLAYSPSYQRFTGSLLFAAPDVPLPLIAGVQSYGRGVKPSGEVKITKDLDHSIEGSDVLIVEDILDTGETFHYLQDVLGRAARRSPGRAARGWNVRWTLRRWILERWV